jgi:hypothetical protein
LKFLATSAAIARVYDLIGDVHGHAAPLELLLKKLGYTYRNGAWRYPRRERTVLFVGDYLDRGPESPAAVRIVREMVDAGTAQAVIGNHEYNALGWHTTDEEGLPLRSHSEVHLRQHRETLEAYRGKADALAADLAWMRRLPFWIDKPTVRVIHATWDQDRIDRLYRNLPGTGESPLADEAFFRNSYRRETWEHDTVEVLLKGMEIPLPGASFRDKDGTIRRFIRIKWWLSGDELGEATDASGMVPLSLLAVSPANDGLGELDGLRVPFSADELPRRDPGIPVFVGHYWLTGTPAPVANSVACLDYSVARGGPLCAFRYDGVLPLRADRFFCI